MANTKLNRTASSTGNVQIWTWSGWVKRAAVPGTVDAKGGLFATYTDANQRLDFGIDANHRFFFKEKQSASTNIDFTSNRLFQDPSAFYHFVVAVDTTDSTAADRVKVYVNGERITSWLDNTPPNQNYNTLMNVSGRTYYIGTTDGSSNYWNGLMSHVHFCDGTALAPTVFGSTDSTTGEWKINTAPSFTPGTNGFTILKDGNTITDQSSNSNDFSLGGGTLTNTEDCPSNVFATWNPLDNYYPAMTLSYGNTRALTVTNKYTYTPTTLGMTSGKYYAEIKCVAKSSSQIEMLAGITSTSSASTTDELGHFANDYGYYSNTGQYRNNNTLSSYGNSWTQDDIIGIAVDLDNNKLYFSKNGTWQNSGVPTSGATGTGAISITDPTSTPRGAYFFAVTNWSATSNATFDANFGNGFFGTTQISSEGTNASGNGKFEYDVPTGYTALSTKGLNL